MVIVDGSSDQTVGMRFNAVAIPRGVTIKNAYLQFTVDETGSLAATALQIWDQATDNALTFTTATNNISSRAKTASVLWIPAAWSTVGAAGADQRTQDIKAVIQEIVNRSGKASGNALVLIITGTDANKRVADDLHGQIFAPAISAFPTSLWVMQEVEQCRSSVAVCRGRQ